VEAAVVVADAVAALTAILASVAVEVTMAETAGKIIRSVRVLE
jgi:hypothetical protein